MCSEFRNFTESPRFNCTEDWETEPFFKCDFLFPPSSHTRTDRDGDVRGEEVNITMTFSAELVPPEVQNTMYKSTTDYFFGGTGSANLMSLFLIKGVEVASLGETRDALPVTELVASTWFWCEKTYEEIVANQTHIISAKVDRWEQVFRVENGSDPYTRDNLANSRGKIYGMRNDSNNPIWTYLRAVLAGELLHQTVRGVRNTALDPLNVSLAYYLWRGNISQITENIAQVVTDQLRSNEGGDNNNVTMVRGKAVYEERFYVMNWPWIIWPLAEILMVIVLLVITMAQTRNQPLLKTSVAALLFHGLDGWRRQDLDAWIPKGKLENMESLDKVTENMAARFQEDDGGVLRFRRVNP